MSRSWYSMILTPAGWEAVRTRALDPSVPPPEGLMLPCPGNGWGGCLAMTPGGRRCRYCARTVYTFRTTEPTLRSTQPLADGEGGNDAG